MPTPILTTKLYIPPSRPQVVRRSRLIERLNEGTQRKLTLISAPAGFGKTTLVSEWVAGCGWPVAWLSLEEAESDPTRFLIYFVAAVQTIAPTVGTGVMEALQSTQPPLVESILTALLNEITTMPDAFFLVLDDYHVIDARAVDGALIFLLDHLPPQAHLIMTTREDPQLPLARLRIRGQLTELRAADLRFLASEAAEFLTEVMGLRLAASDIATLEERTEGWIAGLQLAALSMQGRQDVPGFIRAFAGDNHYIVDYLVDEVLRRQPESIRNFLLQTSLLDRLSGSLCDAVTGQAGGAARLETLHHGNLFLTPLDDKRQWYRYHHLFAEVLSAHLRSEQPDMVAVLHRRASVWYEQHGSAIDAIRHALAAEDFSRVADLIELAMPAMRRMRQDAMMFGWLKALPDALIRRRPLLSALYAHVLLGGGVLAGVEERLRDAERWLDTAVDMPPSSEAAGAMVVVDHEAFRRLPGQIAVARAGLALALGDVPASVAYARRVLELVPADDYFSRGGAAGFLGLAAWTRGDLDAAHRAFADGMAHLQLAGNIADTVGGAVTLAAIRIAQGRLREAMRTYERGLQRATEQYPALGAVGTQPVLRGAADMHVGMSEICREWNDLHAAMQHLERCTELGEHTGFPPHPYRWRVALARIRQVEGDMEGALALLDEAERLYVSDFSPNVRPVAALRARLWIVQGRLGEARDWVRGQRLSSDDDLDYPREFEHITLVRLLLERAKSERADHFRSEALRLLSRLLHAAEAGERMGSIIEILVLQALALQARGNIPAALEPLQRALALAEPEGYVRLFVDEGPAMVALLLEAVARKIRPDYASKLLAAWDVEQVGRAGAPPLPPSPALPFPVEPLSERELDVLRLFKTELSGPEIAHELMIALSTVRTHTKSIFSKLDVTNRRAAVKRATELGLI